jgi:hypothetical protein
LSFVSCANYVVVGCTPDYVSSREHPPVQARRQETPFLFAHSTSMSSTAISQAEEQTALLRGRDRELKRGGLQLVNMQNWLSHPFGGDDTTARNTRERAAYFLSSKVGHYSVIGLVTLDILAIIAGR